MCVSCSSGCVTLPGWRARVVAGHAREGAVGSNLPGTVSPVLPAVHFRNPEMAYTLAVARLMTDLEKMIWEFVENCNEYSFLDLEKAVKLVQREAQSPHCDAAMLPVWRVLESFRGNMDLLKDESERFKVAEVSWRGCPPCTTDRTRERIPPLSPFWTGGFGEFL